MFKKSFRSISITDITKEARVNRSTYYYYYYLKEEILEEIINESICELRYQIKKPYEFVREFTINEVLLSCSNLFKHIYDRKEYYRLLLNNEVSLSFQNKFIEVVLDVFLHDFHPFYSDQPRDVNDHKYKYYINFRVYGILGLIKQWVNEGYPFSPLAMAKQLINILDYKLDKVELGHGEEV